MASPISFLLLIALLATPSLQDSTSQKPIFLDNMPIAQSGNYSKPSAYQHNLETVLSTLETNSNTSSFSETTTGNGSEPVYGRYYCRHDVSLKTCSACIHMATKQIIAGCPNSKEAIIWYDLCTLLYLTTSSRLDLLDFELFPLITLHDFKSNVTDPDKFSPLLLETMDRIINGSAYGLGFATAEAKLSPFDKLYSLAQCSWDTTGLLCERCLRRALHQTFDCCMYTKRMMIFYATCQLRYSVVAPFYDLSLSLPEEPLISPPAAPPATSQASTSMTRDQKPQGNRAVGRSCSTILEIGIVIAITTLMMSKN